jgi:hypothetical protein
VFRARDTKLGGQIAIKVLPGHLAADASARAADPRDRLSFLTILVLTFFGQLGSQVRYADFISLLRRALAISASSTLLWLA